MKLRRMLSLATALLLVTSLPLVALADTWNLSYGDITVSINGQGEQHVAQTWETGSKVIQDSNPTITGGDGISTKITVSTTGEAEANLTIKDVIATTIEVGASNATITVSGNNKVSSGGGAGIHVSSGNLTINGDGTLEAKGNSTSAGIGSGNDEEMSGSITIEDKVTVTVERKDGSGAGIGSGNGGTMSGSITIGDTAKVNASTSHNNMPGVGIGSGAGGDMSGKISISKKASVTATSNGTGDAIGAGTNDEKTGTIEYFDPDPAPTQPEVESAAIYQVLNENGISMGYTSAVKDGVLTITVKGDYARLTGSVASLKTLASWGYNAITLVTDNATSTFALADLMAKGPGTYALTHSGQEVTLTLNGEALTGILK